MTQDPIVLNDSLKHLRKILKLLQRWHRHEVYGLEHIPSQGPVLLVINHSLATYDAFLLGLAIFEKTGRMPKALGDNRIFQTPYLNQFAKQLGILPASPMAGQRLLAEGHMVGVAPGGMREALRPSSQRYSVQWNDRKGFIRLAIATGVPVLLAACPAADRILRIYDNPLTDLAYRYLKIPVPIFRGWGLSFLPRPVKLVHVLAPLLFPPPVDQANFEAMVTDFHHKVVERMKSLMEEARVISLSL